MKVPEGDLRQREREIARKEEGAGWTADTIEQIIIQKIGKCLVKDAIAI